MHLLWNCCFIWPYLSFLFRKDIAWKDPTTAPLHSIPSCWTVGMERWMLDWKDQTLLIIQICSWQYQLYRSATDLTGLSLWPGCKRWWVHLSSSIFSGAGMEEKNLHRNLETVVWLFELFDVMTQLMDLRGSIEWWKVKQKKKPILWLNLCSGERNTAWGLSPLAPTWGKPHYECEFKALRNNPCCKPYV